MTGELLFRFWGAVLGEGIRDRYRYHTLNISAQRFVVNGGNYVPLHTVDFVRDTCFDARERTQLAVEAEELMLSRFALIREYTHFRTSWLRVVLDWNKLIRSTSGRTVPGGGCRWARRAFR